jgi:hypothetical protein
MYTRSGIITFGFKYLYPKGYILKVYHYIYTRKGIICCY